MRAEKNERCYYVIDGGGGVNATEKIIKTIRLLKTTYQTA